MPDNRARKVEAVRRRSSPRGVPAHGSPGGLADFAVVGIGASAGGLDACRKLIGALPTNNGMAFILVQHLDPTHESMMVDLLAGHTSMTVRQATDGMPIERDHLYIIPPGTYLSVGNGALHLSQPHARHGARLPFDFLLHSLAEECGARAICVILSGTGADGSLGLKAVKENGGLVIAQDPDEAGYDGMPRSAIMTGCGRPRASGGRDSRSARQIRPSDRPLAHDRAVWLRRMTVHAWLPEIIDLLRTKTAHDFTLYKQGTLQRRIERRMAMAAIETDDMDRYLDMLRGRRDGARSSCQGLAHQCHQLLPRPGGVRSPGEEDRSRPGPQASRPISRCASGLPVAARARRPILSRSSSAKQITAAKRNIKLQVFASDVDPDAVASAREGLYPETIEADVSPARLARFFTQGRPRLPDIAGFARDGGFHGAGCAGRSAILPSRPRFRAGIC